MPEEEPKEEKPEKPEQEKIVQPKTFLDHAPKFFFYLLISMCFNIFFTFVHPVISMQYFGYLTALFVGAFILAPYFLFAAQKKREEIGVQYRPVNYQEFPEIEKSLSSVYGMGKIKIEAMTREKKFSLNAHDPKVFYFKAKQVLADGTVKPVMFDIPAISPLRDRVFGSIEPGVMRIENKTHDWSGDIKYPYGRAERNIFKIEQKPVRVITQEEQEELEEENE